MNITNSSRVLQALTATVILSALGACADAPGLMDDSGSAPQVSAAVLQAATDPSGGLWIARDQLVQLPMSGAAWTNLLKAANRNCGVPQLSNQTQTNNTCVMAKALVFARTGKTAYRDSVLSSIRSITVAPRYSGRALALGRNLPAYVIAADLVQLATVNPDLDSRFRSTISALRTTVTTDGPASLVECHEQRPNNWGTMCGAARIAVAAYLSDRAELDKSATIFRGWLGDRGAYARFKFGELSWQCNAAAPVAINPARCARGDRMLDGILGDDQRRGGVFVWPAPKENYVYEALQGAVVQAVLLERQGFDPWNWSDRALLRAFTWLNTVNKYPATGDDTWQPYVINKVYGTNFATVVPARPGKNAGWTDWTHAR